VRQPLAEAGDRLDGVARDRQPCALDPARDDLGELGVRHPRHVDLHERALDREVLRDQLLDVIGHADEDDRRSRKLVRERLDRVREQQAVVVRREPVELVDEDRDPPAACERLEPASHVVRRRVVGQQRRRAHLSLAVRRGEADSRFRDREAELAERLAPHALVVVAPVAGRPRSDDARGREHLGGHTDERGLADAALAVDDGVLPRLLGHREEVAELSGPAREEALAVDRRCRPEHLGERPQPLDLLRFPALQPSCHPASIVRPDRPRDKPA
jgi:hypothetical protein